MTACAVIAEWNPFHNGHRLLFEKIREQAPDAVIVGIMSGNYVQRGEASVIDKWTRAEVALRNGCDAVYELPVWVATQSAAYFAAGAVAMAAALGCDMLAFGVETERFADYVHLADWVVAHPDWQTKYSEAATDATNRGQQALQALEALPKRVSELAGLTIDFASGGNTLLAFNYARANARLGYPLHLLPIRRTLGAHDTATLTDGTRYTSSTAIRRALKEKDTVPDRLRAVMPAAMFTALTQVPMFADWEQGYSYLRYRLLSETPERLRECYQVYEGIEQVFIKQARQYNTFEEFLLHTTTRQWTRGRVKRTLLSVLLAVTETEMQQLTHGVQPLFLLGATARGRVWIASRRDQTPAGYRRVDRVDRDAAQRWPLWIRADRVYRYCFRPDLPEQNFAHPPLLL